MRDDIHGRNVGSEDDDAVGDGDGGVGSGDGRFSESLDDFLDTSLEALVDSGCSRKQIVSTLRILKLELVLDKGGFETREIEESFPRCF